MRDKEEQDQQHPTNVLEMEKWRQERKDISEESVSSLLEHMRKVRESVPVNNQLKEALRQKMFKTEEMYTEQAVEEKLMNIPLENSKMTGTQSKQNIKWYCLSVAIIAAICMIWFLQGVQLSKLEAVGDLQEVARYWSEKDVLQPVVSPDGKKLLLTRSGMLLMLDQNGAQLVLLKPGENEKYAYPAWTSDGSKITLIRKIQGGNEEVIQYSAAILNGNQRNETDLKSILENFSSQQPEVLYRGQTGEEISDLHWSPTGNKLAFILKKGQQSSVILLDQEKKIHNLGAGTQLTWSPDSSAMVVERRRNTAELWITDLSSQAELLMQGENPVWSQQGYLVFTDMKSQERILTYMPDGSPLFTVQQKVGEIRSLYLGQNGVDLYKQAHTKNWAEQSKLLINISNQGSLAELKWLRDLTVKGVKEPKVLMLEDIEKNISQCFGPQGKTLYLTRSEGETISVMRADLRETVSLR